MPRRTHPRVRAKHDRGHTRHHAERMAANRWRDLKDKHAFGGWSGENPHPEATRERGIEIWKEEKARNADRLRGAKRLREWEKLVQWSVTVPGKFGTQPYPSLYSLRVEPSWGIWNDVWPWIYPDGLLAVRHPFQCGNRHCSCHIWESAAARMDNRRERYGYRTRGQSRKIAFAWKQEVWE